MKIKPNIKIPHRAIKYIVAQRVNILKLPHTLNKIVHKLKIHSEVSYLWHLIQQERVKQSYVDSITREYESLLGYLPKRLSSILDIGCGIAGIDAMLYKHYNCNDNINFFLADKTKMDREIYYGFRDVAASYNSLPVTKSVLELNGIKDEKIHLINVSENEKLHNIGPVDLVISLTAWGFHFPVSVYLEQVYNLLSDGGSLIIDLRKSTDSEQDLRDKFGTVQLILETSKTRRVVAKKGALHTLPGTDIVRCIK